jgi:hypothetical protein
MADGKRDADKKPFPVVEGRFQKDEPQFSYDGKWLAYTSDKTVPGTFQVYVRSFPAGDQEIAVSTAGGGQPRWRKDGKELYYRAGDNIMAVEIKGGDKIEAGIPYLLFVTPARFVNQRDPKRHLLAVTPDGQRFLPGGVAGGATGAGDTRVPQAPISAATSLDSDSSARANPFSGLTVIQHWTSAIGKADK